MKVRQVSGDDHFRRYIPADGPSAAPPDVKYKPIGQLGARHHEKSRKLPKRDESGSTTGSRGRPESPTVNVSFIYFYEALLEYLSSITKRRLIDRYVEQHREIPCH